MCSERVNINFIRLNFERIILLAIKTIPVRKSQKTWMKNLTFCIDKAMDQSDHVTKLYIFIRSCKITFLIYKVSF